MPDVRADKRALRQVLVNLLTNAIKFSPTQGVIKVSALSVTGGAAEISVTDKGKGISAPDVSKVFDPFFQAGSTEKSKPQGIGIGLSIVKTLVEKMDGTVLIESIPGKGTTAKVRLPFAGKKTG